MPVIVLPMNEVLLWPFIIGCGVALCALVGEGVADGQLHQFTKNQPRGSLAVCRGGYGVIPGIPIVFLIGCFGVVLP